MVNIFSILVASITSHSNILYLLMQENLMPELKSDSTVVCDSEEEMMSSDDDDEEGQKDGGLEWDNSSY